MKKAYRILLITAVILGNSYALMSQNDALKILPDGKVGIGTSDPKTELDVNGTIKGKSLTLSDTLTAKTANFKEGIKAFNGKFTGNVIINNAFVGDVGHGATWAGFSHKDAVGTTSYGFLHNNKGTGSLINIKSGVGYIGFRVDDKDKMVIQSNGNVGIGTTDPKEKLQVDGTIKATNIQANTVNGEKPPMIINVGNKSIKNKWQAVNRDIKSLCGDADGCTMKVFIQLENVTDDVLIVLEQIYIEQPDKSNNFQPGLSGYTKQMGGGYKRFILGTSAMYDIIPPINMPPGNQALFYVRNYGNASIEGLPKGVYKGYEVQFLVQPNVSATVIIYDR